MEYLTHLRLEQLLQKLETPNTEATWVGFCNWCSSFKGIFRDQFIHQRHKMIPILQWVNTQNIWYLKYNSLDNLVPSVTKWTIWYLYLSSIFSFDTSFKNSVKLVTWCTCASKFWGIFDHSTPKYWGCYSLV